MKEFLLFFCILSIVSLVDLSLKNTKSLSLLSLSFPLLSLSFSTPVSYHFHCCFFNSFDCFIFPILGSG